MTNAKASDDNVVRWHALRWAIASLPLAPLALIAFLFFEWLFIVTKPGPTGELPFASQALVLTKSPFPLLLPFLAVQAVASAASLVAYPHFRTIAVLPAAIVCGFLLLLLIDNFTYTMTGFGIMRAGEVLRVAYTVLLGLLTAAAGWKLEVWLSRVFRRRHAVGLAACAIAILMVARTGGGSPLPRDPDPTVLPNFERTLAGSQRPNILFLGADGLDASILSAYGYERQTTPFLKSIREDTLFFENAFSNAAHTHGALVTLLTGRLPFTTRVFFPPTVLQGADADLTLPVMLKGLGYTTLQLGMREYADAQYTRVHGFDAINYRWQRLDEFRSGSPTADDTDLFLSTVGERIDARLGYLFGIAPAVDTFAHIEGRQIVPQWRDERRVATLIQYFQQAPEPWFVHLHLLDTHCCRWVPDRVHFSGGGSPDVDARDSQVRETDGNIRRLFEALQSAGLLERTIVVVLSDHGVGWEIRERVPLMIRFPNRSPRGSVALNVQLADVAPTMLAYLGAEIPKWMDGQSLLPQDALPIGRKIFGVAEMQAIAGPSGFRLLLDRGPPNYGITSVMMVAGAEWFEMGLGSGELKSGHVRGHTRGEAMPPVTEAEARQQLLERIRGAGFVIGRESGP